MPSNSDSRRPRRWRKPLAVVLFVAAALLTLLVCFYMVEKARARSAWQAYEAEAKTRGVKMTFAELLPPPIPDAENYAAIPLIQKLFRDQETGQSAAPPFQLPQSEELKHPPFDNLHKVQRIDLAEWQKYFVQAKLLQEPGGELAADILTALGKYNAPLEELRQAGLRPKSRFPVKWEDGINAALPHLGLFQTASRLYALRMVAHLASGQRAEALQDFRDGLRLYTALREEPSLIAGLVRLSVLSAMENAVWGGLADGQWGEGELRAIEADLAPLRLFADYQLGLASERSFANGIYPTLQHQSPRELVTLLQITSGVSEQRPSPTLATAGASLYPRGWFYRSQLRTNQYIDERLTRVTVDPPRLDTKRPLHSDPKPSSSYDHLQHMLFYLLAPALQTVERRYAASQTVTDQTRLACALERHRLAHGSYPQQLDALAPDFIVNVPRDVMTGEPLQYHLLDGGQRFSLYSVAMNLKDDGGETGGKDTAADQLDWVWRYPEK